MYPDGGGDITSSRCVLPSCLRRSSYIHRNHGSQLIMKRKCLIPSSRLKPWIGLKKFHMYILPPRLQPHPTRLTFPPGQQSSAHLSPLALEAPAVSGSPGSKKYAPRACAFWLFVQKTYYADGHEVETLGGVCGGRRTRSRIVVVLRAARPGPILWPLSRGRGAGSRWKPLSCRGTGRRTPLRRRHGRRGRRAQERPSLREHASCLLKRLVAAICFNSRIGPRSTIRVRVYTSLATTSMCVRVVFGVQLD